MWLKEDTFYILELFSDEAIFNNEPIFIDNLSTLIASNDFQIPIEQAKKDPSTATDAKTWYVAGRIGYTLANKEWNKRYLNQTPGADL